MEAYTVSVGRFEFYLVPRITSLEVKPFSMAGNNFLRIEYHEPGDKIVRVIPSPGTSLDVKITKTGWLMSGESIKPLSSLADKTTIGSVTIERVIV
ncbi:hypothetical protein DRN75_01375 [Nanoarchaeota archaeon]|nr:MAG: hypothetical protein DRN75_01375 [Nanoarchaeota archaeon]